jgi:hypothetical protein
MPGASSRRATSASKTAKLELELKLGTVTYFLIASPNLS